MFSSVHLCLFCSSLSLCILFRFILFCSLISCRSCISLFSPCFFLTFHSKLSLSFSRFFSFFSLFFCLPLSSFSFPFLFLFSLFFSLPYHCFQIVLYLSFSSSSLHCKLVHVFSFYSFSLIFNLFLFKINMTVSPFIGYSLSLSNCSSYSVRPHCSIISGLVMVLGLLKPSRNDCTAVAQKSSHSGPNLQ